MGDVLPKRLDTAEEARTIVLEASREERMRLAKPAILGATAFDLPIEGSTDPSSDTEKQKTPEGRISRWRTQFATWMNRTVDDHSIENDMETAKTLRGTPISEYPGVYHDKNAKDIATAKVPEGTFARYFEGTGKGPLVILVLGHMQEVDEEAGFNQAYQYACETGCHVLLLEVGQYLARARGVPAQQTDVMYEHGLNVVEAFADPKKHSQLVVLGHSWGGGTLARAMTREGKKPSDLEQRIKGIRITETAYIDPVHLGSRNAGFAVSSIPLHEGMHTHVFQGAETWQDKLNIFNIDGSEVDDSSPRITQIRMRDADHYNIDEKSLPLMKEIILRASLPKKEKR